MTSIVIAAHNESAVIARCLDSLLAEARPGEFDVVVVPNGCSDDTALIAAGRRDVRVVEIEVASKSAALNAGDAAALGFPRIYLDADIVVSTAGVRAVCAELGSPGDPAPAVLAAVPRRRLELRGRPPLVRAYFAISSRLPVFSTGLFGRGMIAVSAEGRSRFGRFPDMIADDLFLDSLFRAAEKREASSVETVVESPRRTGDLLRRLVRVRRGNNEMRAAGSAGELDIVVRQGDRLAWLRDVVLPRPWLAPAAVVYVVITTLAAFQARRAPRRGKEWGRDESSRVSNGEARAR